MSSLSARLAASLDTNSIVRKGNGRTERVRANGSDIFLTAGVTRTGETAADPDVDLAAVGEYVDGIIVGTADTATDLSKDSDSPYADNVWLLMYRPMATDEVYMTVKGATAVTVYTRQGCDGGFIAPYTYASGTSIDTDTLAGYCCIAQEAAAGATITEYVILTIWSGN